MKLFFFDLETTGFSPNQNGVHQIAGKIRIHGETKEVFDFKVRPFDTDKINAKALEVGGVTLEQIQAYPDPVEVYKQIIDLLSKYVDKYDKGDKFFLVGYNNASFDNPFLREFFNKNNDPYFGSWFWSSSLDVMILATPFLARKRHLMPNFKLMTVAKFCNIVVDESRLHESGYDVELTEAIFDKVIG